MVTERAIFSRAVFCAAAPRESGACVTSVRSNAAKAAMRIKALFFIILILSICCVIVFHIPYFICHCRKLTFPAMTNEIWNMKNRIWGCCSSGCALLFFVELADLSVPWRDDKGHVARGL